MASSSHLEDEEFDWDAAVLEIDVVCHGRALDTTHEEHCDRYRGGNSECAKQAQGLRTRQSSLDDFVNTSGKRHFPQESISCGVDDNPAAGNRIPVEIDCDTANTWIYPVNVPLRNYQFNIVKTALFSNTLVALPTGLGKTLIAAVVIYNYFRWFPKGKIVFAAPSRPLVLQQIEACHNIVGIPQEWTIDMTGQTSPAKRAYFWRSKRVFFLTPQVLEKDIHSGSCLVRQLVCLVIDEAHRAMGNYAYCAAVRELMAVPVQLRILALTATPGSKHPVIQNLINNLHISTLEYRNEDDIDVCQYVHNRQLELIQVAMGNDAIEADNLLFHAIQPFLIRLSAFGVLEKRNFTSLSPCDLLNLREKFRQAPPEDLVHEKYGEIEGYFGVLISLYHIRKLLSSHGIRPAYEMLEEKLQQGSFARLMGRNETVWKVKLLMQKSLSNGAPTPKLVKLTEVLGKHFKAKNPKDSRVIIFSNFRGSVKDIMELLGNIGEPIKATKFVGQSSGKSSKGQSQRVQQEVLRKFRSGGFNVIVATSIGEEGLDIMEVDLVICFDANISPLRMVQRMGRTGRNHDGRVVVLACEGPELKGYSRKLACSKTLGKHMRNGGKNSFDFHPSPRMVPHIFRPEVQFVELSIKRFVPRRMLSKRDSDINASSFLNIISHEESELISKYFGSPEVVAWEPSLVAFPHFQAFPSQVNEVRHSARTTELLIHTMEHLERLSTTDQVFSPEAKAKSTQIVLGMGDAICDKNNNGRKDNFIAFCESRIPNVEEPSSGMPRGRDESSACEAPEEASQHSFLFGSDFISLDSSGIVHVLSPPAFHYAARSLVSPNKCGSRNSFPDSIHECSHFRNDKQLVHSPICKNILEPKGYTNTGSASDLDVDVAPVCELIAQVGEPELSPRLASLMLEGMVPESPIMETCLLSPGKMQDTCDSLKMSKKLSPLRNDFDKIVEVDHLNAAVDGRISSFIQEMHTPLLNQKGNSSVEDWYVNSGHGPISVSQRPRLKRLRTYGDCSRRFPLKALTEEFSTEDLNICRFSAKAVSNLMWNKKGKQKAEVDIEDFIENEAEVSADVDVSEDEAGDMREDQYEQSFIDDSFDPKAANTQSEANEVDMMAIYRRSLLTPSPQVCLPEYTANLDENTRTPSASECGSCSLEKNNSFHFTPNACCLKESVNSVTYQMDLKRVSELSATKGETDDFLIEPERTIKRRKRKLYFDESDPFSSKGCLEASMRVPAESKEMVECGFPDDHFYEGLDLDALEQKAINLLRCNLSTIQRQESLEPRGKVEDMRQVSAFSPSFDLGF